MIDIQVLILSTINVLAAFLHNIFWNEILCIGVLLLPVQFIVRFGQIFWRAGLAFVWKQQNNTTYLTFHWLSMLSYKNITTNLAYL